MVKIMENINLTKTEEIFKSNHCPFHNFYQGNAQRLLFVCTAGLLRSPSCAAIGAQLGFNTRSAGSEDQYALIPVTYNLIMWADFIVFMNSKNKDEVLEKFSGNPEAKELIKDKAIVWDIPDNYEYMEATLQRIIKDKFNATFETNI